MTGGVQSTMIMAYPLTFLLLSLMPELWLSTLVIAQISPCDPASKNTAVFLPQTGLCLIPISNKKSWLAAQTVCEENLGSLYRLPDDGQLRGVDGMLGQCLSAMPSSSNLQDSDFWMGVVSNYSRQWFWVNGTLLNPIRYVTTDETAFQKKQDVNMCSYYLSIDYCVLECHTLAAAYTVVNFQKNYPCCFCSFSLDTSKVQASPQAFFNASPHSSPYYVAQAGEGSGNLIRLFTTEAFSQTDTLCATVDTNTVIKRELTSKTCFSEFPFLCSLGTNRSVACDSVNCQDTWCQLRVREECVQRDSRRMTWFRARAECRALGGDLWTLGRLNDMHQVHQALKENTQYWIGAINHNWSFSAVSDIFGSDNPDYEAFRCGHMFQEQSGETTRQWLWSDTRCDQQKSYICQYPQTIHTTTTTDKEVICPWEIITTPSPVTASPASPTNNNSNSNSSNPNGSFVTDGPLSAAGSDSIIPIIAAVIAAATILMCALFVLGYARQRRWQTKKMRRSRDYLWPFWASTPTFLSPSHASFDSLSTGHTGVHSDNGSVFHAGAFVFPDPTHPVGEGGGANRSHAYSRVGSRSREEPILRDRLNGSASVTSGRSRLSPGGVGFEEGVTGGGGRERDGQGGASAAASPAHSENLTNQMDAYRPNSPRSKEYMTLSAHMNIQEDYDSLYSTVRRKPEVALVTNDVDLNFTVNHAYPRSRSPPVSERSIERGVDEIDMPVASHLQIPTRAMEESMLNY